ISDFTSPNCFIHVTTTDVDRIKFFLQVSKDKQIDLEYYPTVTFQQIKEDIASMYGFPLDKQAYVLTVDPEESDRTLMDSHKRPVEFGFKDGTVMDLRTEPTLLKVKIMTSGEIADVV